jgi:hypothetical protein
MQHAPVEVPQLYEFSGVHAAGHLRDGNFEFRERFTVVA